MRPLTVPLAAAHRTLRCVTRALGRVVRAGWWPTVELAGAALLVVCVGLYEPRLAVGLAGLMLLVAANFRARKPPAHP